MHTLVEVPVGANGGTHVPAFLAKLWKIVDDSSTNDLICWNEMGNSFIIRNQAKFARDLLPLYYKHNNMASFVRQLNMYGFHKVVSVEQGGLRVDKDEMEFAHPFFLKGQEASLELIKRKIPASKHEETRVRPDSLNKVLMDVRQMKGRQETMDNKLLTMKRENEALWRELASLRQKHAKQTQIVSKLLQFLVGMMSQQTPRLAFKRRMPLMLNDKEGVKQKLSRTEVSELTGPVIHDVTELVESDDSVEDSNDQAQVAEMSNFGISEWKPKADGSFVSSKSTYHPEAAVGGRISPESSALLFPVNPSTVNPTGVVSGITMPQVKQNTDQRKQAVKRNSNTASLPAIKSEGNLTFSNIQAPIPQNVVQSAAPTVGSSSVATITQAENTIPTTLYFTAPGMTEPVQVVLSLPDQASTAVPISGVQNVAPVVIPTSTISPGKGLNVSQPPSTNVPTSKATTVNNAMDVVGRNQPANSKFLVKTNPNTVHEDLDGHLDEVEMGLNNLRDLFKGNNEYQIDGDTLIGVSRPFNLAAIDPDTYSQLFGETSRADNLENEVLDQQQPNLAAAPSSEISIPGQELVAYNPSLFELAEDDSNFFDESSNIFLDDELESMLTTDRDSLVKRLEGQNRGVGQLSFSAANLNNSLDSGLNTPVVSESVSPPGTSSGASKRKRK